MKKYFTKENVVFVIFVVFLFIVFRFVLINAFIPSGSMENTLHKGDRILGFRLVKEYKRGDIAIFHYDDHEYFIKRIIGIGGDTVSIKNNQVYVNGEKLDEPYIKEAMDAVDETYQVPEGEYFFLGDNRNNSADSRYWEYPFRSDEAIVARAVFRYWPLNKIGLIQ